MRAIAAALLAMTCMACKSDADAGSTAPPVASKPDGSGIGARLSEALSGSGVGHGIGSGSATGSGVGSGPGSGSGAITTIAPRVPIAVSAELAAIKLALQPNWDRDVGKAATISLVVKHPPGPPLLFEFDYGYDDPKAPTDHDAYIKFLGDQKLMTQTINRQRGAAWYIEGRDARGPAFRYVVNYGGKHLICFGSLYKDADSDKLGDLRDDVVAQAKKICESISL